MSDATSSSIGELPPPDYVDTSLEEDPTLRVPVIIHYDAWRKGSGNNNDRLDAEPFPEPPAELLAEQDEGFPEPPPDYEGQRAADRQYPGLIPPHKLPNPVLDSKDRMKINKDIKFNAKRGINGLDTKPELEKELLRRKQEKQKRESADEQRKNRNSLEQKLEIQKERLEQQTREENIPEEDELTKMHNKIKAKSSNPQ